MYITKEKFEQICKGYGDLLIVEGDAVKALNFVHDLLTAEADAIKEKEPTATVTIKRLEDAAYEVFSVSGEVDWQEFREE